MAVRKDEVKPQQGKEKVAKRILYFSDGTLEEFSTDEDEADLSIAKKQVPSLEPSNMKWVPWFWYQSTLFGSKVLGVCDYFGESFATFFGIITPKYQAEIEHHKKMLAEEEKLNKARDIEMAGWTDSVPDNVVDSQAKMNSSAIIKERY